MILHPFWPCEDSPWLHQLMKANRSMGCPYSGCQLATKRSEALTEYTQIPPGAPRRKRSQRARLHDSRYRERAGQPVLRHRDGQCSSGAAGGKERGVGARFLFGGEDSVLKLDYGSFTTLDFFFKKH